MGRSGAAGSAPRTGDPVKARRARSEATARRWIIERLLRDRETPEAARPPEKYLRTGRAMVSGGVSKALSPAAAARAARPAAGWRRSGPVLSARGGPPRPP